MEPAFMELLGSLPTTWDTTIILEANVGDNIVTARRKDNDWFIGGMCAKNAKDIKINFSFLAGGKYAATICRDGINADRNAMDYVIEESTAQNDSSLNIHLAPNGGFLLKLTRNK